MPLTYRERVRVRPRVRLFYINFFVDEKSDVFQFHYLQYEIDKNYRPFRIRFLLIMRP